jgi:hypothetical protein
MTLVNRITLRTVFWAMVADQISKRHSGVEVVLGGPTDRPTKTSARAAPLLCKKCDPPFGLA